MVDGARPAPPVAIVLGDGRPPADVALIAAACHHRLDPLLFDSLLRRERIATRTRAMAVEALEQAGERTARLVGELRRVTSLLAAAGIPALPLKGPLLAQLLWDDPRLRRCRDLDVLVPAARIPAATAALETAGYRLVAPPAGLLRQAEFWHAEFG